MMPLSPSDLLNLGTILFLASLGLIVFGKLITGAINTRGLLRNKPTGDAFSPARFQLLILTIIALAQFVSGADLNQSVDPKMPPLDKNLFLLLAGSQAIYLAGKSNAFFGFFKSAKYLN